MSILKRNFLFVAIVLVAIFYIYDLSNLDGLRQGTEGFYLQISKEMSEKSSWLTPYYRGERHWSKPPLHFLFPFPLYSLGIFTNLFAARLSIALLTIGLLLLTARWIKNHFNIENHTSFLFLASSVGMIKYARIFMMEIPLSLLTFVGTIYFYDYIKSQKLKDLWLPTILLASSILIKGPVSYVLSLFSIGVFGLYYIWKHKKWLIKPIAIFATLSLALGSIWFIISYINYGDEFFNYFFLRENVGKFNTKSYPMRHVFQGLLIFTLPWSFYLPYSYLNFKDYFTGKDHAKKDIIIYLMICTFFFFVIWLIPTQRSHHYAMPAVPFLLTLLVISLVKVTDESKRYYYYKFSTGFLSILAFILIGVLSVATYYIDVILPGQNLSWFMILTLIILFSAITVFIKFNNLTFKSIASLVFICWIWVFLAPKFIPPFIPQKVIQTIADRPVTAYVRKPYFVEEAIDRKIKVVGKSELKNYVKPGNDIYLINYDDFVHYRINDKAKVLESWEIWRRRTKLKQVINALKNNDISSLKQKYVLFEAKL